MYIYPEYMKFYSIPARLQVTQMTLLLFKTNYIVPKNKTQTNILRPTVTMALSDVNFV